MSAGLPGPQSNWRSHLRQNGSAAVQALKACAAAVAQGAVLGLAVLAGALPSAVDSGRLPTGSAITERVSKVPAAETAGPGVVGSAAANLSALTRQLAVWITRTRDNGDAPFVIVDKRDAHLYLFDARGHLLASTAVLWGSALGDVSVAGIDERPIALVRPEERMTPAGRFVAERGRNARGEDVVWVDYDAAVSIHRVITDNLAERRLERLAALIASDKRIS